MQCVQMEGGLQFTFNENFQLACQEIEHIASSRGVCKQVLFESFLGRVAQDLYMW